mmetsp:Transcript_35639/g.114052  ORF Transcript_35639/g.114052 Transcript_35639/m.114052 type:complete len:501 (-) Transcript_35639:928-2430(-)
MSMYDAELSLRARARVRPWDACHAPVSDHLGGSVVVVHAVATRVGDAGAAVPVRWAWFDRGSPHRGAPLRLGLVHLLEHPVARVRHVRQRDADDHRDGTAEHVQERRLDVVAEQLDALADVPDFLRHLDRLDVHVQERLEEGVRAGSLDRVRGDAGGGCRQVGAHDVGLVEHLLHGLAVERVVLRVQPRIKRRLIRHVLDHRDDEGGGRAPLHTVRIAPALDDGVVRVANLGAGQGAVRSLVVKLFERRWHEYVQKDVAARHRGAAGEAAAEGEGEGERRYDHDDDGEAEAEDEGDVEGARRRQRAALAAAAALLGAPRAEGLVLLEQLARASAVQRDADGHRHAGADEDGEGEGDGHEVEGEVAGLRVAGQPALVVLFLPLVRQCDAVDAEHAACHEDREADQRVEGSAARRVSCPKRDEAVIPHHHGACDRAGEYEDCRRRHQQDKRAREVANVDACWLSDLRDGLDDPEGLEEDRHVVGDFHQDIGHLCHVDDRSDD